MKIKDFINGKVTYDEYGGLVDTFTGKEMQSGHIVAVRYVWNSYVGQVGIGGLLATGSKRFAFFSPHSIDGKAGAYQIIGHINKEHPDYNEDVLNWYKSEEGNCPIKLRIYDNMESVG